MSTQPGTEPGPSLHEVAGRVYRDGGWPVTEMDGDGYAIDVEGSDGSWTAMVVVDDEDLLFVFYSLAPVEVPLARLERVSEFVDRANHGLVGATFELDRDSGEVRLRSGIELGAMPPEIRDDERLLEALVLDLSAANIGLFDRYLPALTATVLGDVPVAEIVAETEGR